MANSASASIISLELSTHASEPIDPSILAATFDFSVTGQTLTLTVTNNTSLPNEYNINRIYFNANANVGNLTSSSTGQFDLNAISGNADGFGMFDFVLSHGPPAGENHHLIQPGFFETFFLGCRVFDPDSLDDDDKMRFDCIIAALFQNFEASFAQSNRGVITDDDWVKWMVRITQYMAQAGVQA